MAAAASAAARDKKNWLIHLVFARGEIDACLAIIEETLRAHNALCEYPLYIKGLIRRQQGNIQESLQLFQAATALNPRNVANLKQVARSLELLGRHRAAIDVYVEAQNINNEDRQIWHNMGLCYTHLKQYEKAEDAFLRANDIARHDSTFLALAQMYSAQDQFRRAIETLEDALEYTPENSEILTTLGLLHLRTGESFKAFEHLSNSLTHDPKNAKTILAAGSIIQDHNDFEVALSKYRVAALQTPNSAHLWNNIGMAFFGKQKHVAAISCLKRALYLDPFEWIVAYNLGLVHLHTEQYASAFHYFSAAINLKPSFASSYMYLGLALSKLEDTDNACAAYEKAISIEADHHAHLNYAVLLHKVGDVAKATDHLRRFDHIFEALSAKAKTADPDVLDTRKALGEALGISNYTVVQHPGSPTSVAATLASKLAV